MKKKEKEIEPKRWLVVPRVIMTAANYTATDNINWINETISIDILKLIII